MESKSGTHEWASKTINIQFGCSNDCVYCYAKSMVVNRKLYPAHPKTAETWKTEEIDEQRVARKYGKIKGMVMFPSMHDISTNNIESCLIVLRKLLFAGNDILIVSKPRIEVIKILCSDLAPFKKQITFRFSIGSSDSTILKEYEPGASSFDERIESLAHAYSEGYSTSVSSEPMLDLNPYAIYDATEKYITDTIWFGTLNRINNILPPSNPQNREMNLKLNALLRSQNNEFIERLYQTYRSTPKVRWKDSIRTIAYSAPSFH